MSFIDVDVDDVPGADDDFVAAVRRLSRDLRQASVNLSEREVRYLVAAYYNIQEIRIRSMAQEKRLVKEELPHLLISWLGDQCDILEGQIRAALDKFGSGHRYAQWPRSIFGIGPVISSGLVAYFDPIPPPTVGHWWSFAGLDPNMVWKAGEKRPFNAILKVLQWKMSGSFVKFSGNEKDIYGKWYRLRKEYEIKNNDQGVLVDQAKKGAMRVGRDTDAWPWYAGCYPAGTSADYEAEGKGLVTKAKQEAKKALLARVKGEPGSGLPLLPPGHIDNRARRWTAKIFISHYHFMCYWIHFNKAPPEPFPITHLGHAHIEMPPGWERFVPL